jgi:hypothetical protein
MPTTTRTAISNALIIKALNTPGGSGGVYKEMERLKRSTIAQARFIAPIGKPDNAMHRGGVTGRYKASFGSDRKGSNGHFVRRTVYNTAPYAYYVEFGRQSTKFTLPTIQYKRMRAWIARTGGVPRGWERYSSVYTGGIIVTNPGAAGWDGFHVLEMSFAEALLRSNIHIGATGRFRL